MKVRLGLVLLLLIGPAAFAPAPVPRTSRRSPSTEITLASFQGTWRVTNMVTSRPNGQHTPYTWSVTHIRVSGTRWDFMTNDSSVSTRQLSIDHTRKPAHLNFHDGPTNNGSIGGVGLIRRHGGQVQVIYTWGGESSRAASFDPAPDGHWIITMQRE